MKIVAVVGPSGVGKSSLNERLVAELKKRSRSVAVIKHCSQGFSLDYPGKDSWRFREAGADGVALVSPRETAVLQWSSAGAEDVRLASSFFGPIDFVIVEGRRPAPRIPKLELLRKGVAERVSTPLAELAAVVADFDVVVSRPLFHFRQVKEIVDFLELGARPRRPACRVRSRKKKES